MKKVLALVVIAGSITLFSCNNGDKAKTDADKAHADSMALKVKADSVALKNHNDSVAKMAVDTSHKAAMDTVKKDVKAIDKDVKKVKEDVKKVPAKK